MKNVNEAGEDDWRGYESLGHIILAHKNKSLRFDAESEPVYLKYPLFFKKVRSFFHFHQNELALFMNNHFSDQTQWLCQKLVLVCANSYFCQKKSL